MNTLVRIVVGLAVLTFSGCFSTEIAYTDTVNITEIIEKQEQQVLSQFRFASSGKKDDIKRTEANLRTIMKQVPSCDIAFVAYLILAEKDPAKRLKRLPDRLPAVVEPYEYAPGNPQKCKKRDVKSWLEEKILSSAQISFGLFIPRKKPTEIDSDASSLSLEQLNKCIDLTENPKYFRLRDLDLNVESNSTRFPDVEVSIYTLPDNDIRKRGFRWRPSPEDMKSLKGSMERVATSTKLHLEPGAVQNIELKWKSNTKSPFLDGLLAKQNAAIFQLSGVKLREEKDKTTGRAFVIKPSGSLQFQVKVLFDARIRGSQLSYCSPLISKILSR